MILIVSNEEYSRRDRVSISSVAMAELVICIDGDKAKVVKDRYHDNGSLEMSISELPDFISSRLSMRG